METKNLKQSSLNKQRPLFFAVGLLISVSLTLMAFEYRTPIYYSEMIDSGDDEEYEIQDIPKVIRVEKPKPKTEQKLARKKKKQPSSEIVITDKIDTLFIKLPDPIDPLDGIDFGIDSLEVEEPPIQEPRIFEMVEKMPEFCGGEPAFFKFLAKNIIYPQMAKEAGISGIVYVSFVVRKNGETSDIKTLKGIGGGCDREAMRVIKKMCWVPGEQRGKPVAVRFTLPVNFVLK